MRLHAALTVVSSYSHQSQMVFPCCIVWILGYWWCGCHSFCSKHLTFHCSEPDVSSILLVRYNGTCILSVQSAFIGVRYFCHGHSCRRCIRHDRWWCPYPTYSVRHTCSRQQPYISDVFMQTDVALRILSSGRNVCSNIFQRFGSIRRRHTVNHQVRPLDRRIPRHYYAWY